jgi:hypothetical protein
LPLILGGPTPGPVTPDDVIDGTVTEPAEK